MGTLPDYKTHDPRGWCGDPQRGAALGRGPAIVDVDPATFTGKMVLRRIHLHGDYDQLGTYWGSGAPLYWYAASDADGNTLVDGVTRAEDREHAKEIVRSKFPKVRFYR